MTALQVILYIATGIAAGLAGRAVVRYGRTLSGPNQMVLGSVIVCALLGVIIVGVAGL